MLNYETLLSSYDDRLTLMQWLKKVEGALKDASAVSFDVVNYGNATLAFKIDFADGSSIESNRFVLQKGDSVESAAFVNGHLILTLTNGDEIDAGDLLGGNVNIGGNLDISGNVLARGDIHAQGDITAQTLSQNNYNFEQAFNTAFEPTQSGLTLSVSYAKFVVINKVLYIVGTFKLKNETGATINLSNGQRFMVSDNLSIPSSLAEKIYDINGTPLDQPASSGIALVASDNTYIETSLYSLGYASRKNAYAYMNHGGGSRVNFQIFTGEAVSIADQQEIGTEFRYVIVL